MMLPGFAAEAALAAPSRSYGNASFAGRGDGTMVSPAQARWAGSRRPGGLGRPCIEGCICVSPDGCPCCDSMPIGLPKARREPSTALTCEPGSAGMCEEWCDHSGGGMSRNPDGSTTCTVYH